MPTNGPKFVVDKRCRKKAIVLDVKDYRGLLDRLVDLEDAPDLDEAVRTAEGFRDYREIREELSREGRVGPMQSYSNAERNGS